jgi:TolB protein
MTGGSMTPRKLLEQPYHAGVSLSPDGKALVTSTGLGKGSAQVEVVDIATGKRTVIATNGDPQEPSWSPNGDLIAFTTGDGDLFSVRPDGTRLRQLTRSGDSCGDIAQAWSPDGSMLAFGRGCTTSTGGGIYTMNADGSGIRRLWKVEGDVQGLSWSSDGATLAYGSGDNDRPGIYSIRVEGGTPMRLTTEIDFAPIWSSNDEAIAFLRGEQIWSMTAGGEDQAQITSLDLQIRWWWAWLPNT